MKNGITFFKYSVILVPVIFLFLLFRKCGDGKSSPTKTDTAKRDRQVFVDRVIFDTHYVPQVKKIFFYKIEYKTDTLESFEKVDSSAILRDYLSKRHYRDTIKNKYGYVVVYDTIYKNAILGRRTITRLEVPTVKETVTLTQPKRNILYVGFGVMGNQKELLFGTSATLGWKTKNDKMYEVGGWLTKTGDPMYSIGIKLPIKTRK